MMSPIHFGSKVELLTNYVPPQEILQLNSSGDPVFEEMMQIYPQPKLILQLEPSDGPLYDRGYRFLGVYLTNTGYEDSFHTTAKLAKADRVGESVSKQDLDEFRKVISNAPIDEGQKDCFLRHTTSDTLGG